MTDNIKLANIIVSNGKNQLDREQTAEIISLGEPPHLISYKWVIYFNVIGNNVFIIDFRFDDTIYNV